MPSSKTKIRRLVGLVTVLILIPVAILAVDDIVGAEKKLPQLSEADLQCVPPGYSGQVAVSSGHFDSPIDMPLVVNGQEIEPPEAPPASVDDALGEYVAWVSGNSQGLGLDVGDFVTRAEASREIDFQVTQDGRVVRILRVAKVDSDTWAVDGAVWCGEAHDG